MHSTRESLEYRIIVGLAQRKYFGREKPAKSS